MVSPQPIRILFVEPDSRSRRVVELYFRGFSGKGLEIETVGEPQDVYRLADKGWDVILVDTEEGDQSKADILKKIHNRMAHIPVVALGGGTKHMITTGGADNLDDVLPKLTVNTAYLLRTITHLLQCRRLENRIEELKKELVEVSHTDTLSGLWNRHYITERITEEFMNWERYQHPLTICMIDINEFEYINDTYGYEVADEVLRSLGKLLYDQKRNTDYAGRYSNETFCMVFPQTPLSSALIGVERIRKAILRTLFTGKAASNFTVSVSFGVVQVTERHSHITDLIGSARQALKKAKAAGENRVEVAGADPPASGPKILIVDGDEAHLDLCRDVLEEKGFVPRAARNGREAIEALQEGKYDLFVVDLQLSDMSGQEVIRRISASRNQNSPRIIATGSASDAVDQDELQALGVEHFLHKPFSPQSIVALGLELTGADSS